VGPSSVGVELGERYAALGLPRAARAAFARADDGADPLPPRRLAELALALGEVAAAREHAAIAAAREPGAHADVLAARAALAAGELAAARRGFARALEAAPSPPLALRAHLGRGQVALAEGDARGAAAQGLAGLAALLAAPALDVEAELPALDDLAALLAAAGGLADADARVAELPAAPAAALAAAALAAARERLDERGAARAAEEAWARAAARHPDAPSVRLRLLEGRLGRRAPDDVRRAALDELAALVAAHAARLDGPRDLALHARLCFALAAALEVDPAAAEPAAAAYRAGLRHRPGHAAAANQLAVLALARDALPEAFGAIEAALRVDAAHALAWRSAARALDVAGQGGAVEAHLARLLDAAAPGAGRGLAAVAPRLVRAAAEVARTDVLAGVYTRGHRLKNLLGVVGARARAARRDATGPLEPRLAELERELTELHAEWAGYLRSMESAGPRLERLAIAPLVAEVIAAAAPLGAAPIDARVPQGLPDLRGDRLLLREALLNVVINALEACGERGGQVVVAARAIVGGGSTVLEVAVTDDGPGIPPADRPRLFSPGFTTKPAGSGIGLAVAARAVEAHQGRILIDSEPGRGTTVTLLLPTDVAGAVGLPTGGA
jgi:signal transduction histidine kinase